MSTRPDVHGLVATLLRKAAEDIAVAEAVIPKSALAAMVCFHAQQAIEKIAKAALASAFVPYPRTHDLAALSELIDAAACPNLRSAVAVADWLTSYATGTRYGEGGIPATGADAARAMNDVAAVVGALRADTGAGLPAILD